MSYQLQPNAPGSKIIYFDSRDGQYPINNAAGDPITSDVIFYFDDALTVQSHVDTLISCHAASIPFSFYLIRENQNNVLELTIGKNSTEVYNVETSLVFPSGNYSPAQIASEFETLLKQKLEQLSAAGGALNGVWATPVFAPKCTYLEFKNKLVFQWHVPSNTPTGDHQTPDIQVRFRCGPTEASTITRELGFTPTNSSFFALTAGGDITGFPDSGLDHVAGCLTPNCIDLVSSVHSIFVRTNLTTSSTLDSATKNFSTILTRIPIGNVTTGKIIHHTGNSTHQALTKLGSIRNIRIRLTDDRNRLLQLGGLSFQVSILFNFVYNEKPIPGLTREEKSLIGHHDDRHLLAQKRKTAADKIKRSIIKDTKSSPKHNGTIQNGSTVSRRVVQTTGGQSGLRHSSKTVGGGGTQRSENGSSNSGDGASGQTGGTGS